MEGTTHIKGGCKNMTSILEKYRKNDLYGILKCLKVSCLEENQILYDVNFMHSMNIYEIVKYHDICDVISLM